MTYYSFKALFQRVTLLLLLVSSILNLYIYNYFRIDSRCTWTSSEAVVKLLAFGDPQIRGVDDSSSLRTKLDLWGNDHYLSHIYNVLAPNLAPTHVAVMGDLISSQWISDDEFYERGVRFSERIFRQGITPQGTQFFNICGNHDVGYGGELTHNRMRRYNKVYGAVNFVKEYDEGYRIVVMNSLAMDGPVWEPEYQNDVHNFLDTLKANPFSGPTILLTHVPLYKPEGLCRDGPYFSYYGSEFNNVLREQNHLSESSTRKILESVFNPQYNGVIMTGHDHEGCTVQYQLDKSDPKGFEVLTHDTAPQAPRILEATVRSMMGEFGGNAGLLTAFKKDGNWTFEYQLCPFRVQHLWWTTQVVTIVSILFLSANLFI